MSQNNIKEQPSPANHALTVATEEGETEAQAMGRLVLEPGLRHGLLANCYAAPVFNPAGSVPSLDGTVQQLRKLMDKAAGGDAADHARTLAAQAAVLDNMFIDLCRRALLNANDYPQAAEKYTRLALKAQARCAATLETLSAIQRPNSETPRHVTVAEGGQAIVADEIRINHFHGETENGFSNDQSHAPHPEHGESPALLCEDARWNAVPRPRGERQEAMPDARRHKSGGPKGK
jgi:hypothetical protein